MASVGTPIKVLDNEQADGRRYVKVIFPCVDNNGDPYDKPVGPTLVGANADVEAWAISHKSKILADLAAIEEQGVLDIESVANPLTYAQNPKWSTTNKIMKAAINHLMAEKDVRFCFYLEPMITFIQANYTAQQVATALEISVADVQRMNRRIKAVLEDTGTMQELTAAYDAEEGEF